MQKYLLGPTLLLCFLLGMAPGAHAQMFSLDEDEAPRLGIPANEFYLGFEPTQVTYRGSDDIERAGQYEYDAPLLRVGYRNRSVNLYMGVGGSVTGSDDTAYFDAGGNVTLPLSLYTAPKFRLQVPFRISSRYVNITNNQTAFSLERFRFGSLIAGAGLRAAAQFTSAIRMQLSAVPSYGFTFASGGFFGGGLGTVALNGRLYLDRLFSDDFGLSLGYKYDFRNYNVENEKFDYRMQGHSIQVGITF